MAEIGSIVDGKYEILKEIGHGGMSVVYLAMDQRLNKQWAVKELQKKARDKHNNIIIQSSIAEANMMKRLDHPALPRIVDIIDNETEIYVIMDYIEGESLDHILKDNGAQPQDIVIEWGKQLCEVLDYLHSQNPPVIYRDMKPHNVMLKPEGNVKLIDFGIAREYKEEKHSDTTVLGTRGYAAPEQFDKGRQSDARTDIYSLGATLFHLVTGKNPLEVMYDMPPIRSINPALSGGLENIIIRCLQNDPNDRYQSVRELLYALEHYEEYDDAYREAQRKKRNRFFISCGLTFVSLCIGSGALLMRNLLKASDYNQNIEYANKTSDQQEKLDYFLRAIAILPNEASAYEGLLEAFKNDARFDVEEERLFKRGVETYLEELKGGKEYANIAFEIGKLYWYYYDYGDSGDISITRMKSAKYWFEEHMKYGDEADSNYLMAKVYADIGQFHQDITLNVEEASDTGLYRTYWDNMNELMTLMDQEKEQPEIVKLEFYRLVISSIENYARKFKGDQITQEEMLTMLDKTARDVAESAVTTDKTTAMKQDIIARAQEGIRVVNIAFQPEVKEETQS